MTATTTHAPGDPSAAPAGTQPNGGVVGLLWVWLRTEVRAAFRSVEFVIGVVGVPLLLYGMFGLTSADQELPGGTGIGVMMLVSLTAYGIVSLAIFTFGDDLAKERGRGWTRTLRATPVPSWVHLAGKVAMAAVYGAIIVASLGVLATVAGAAALDAWTWLGFGASMLGGVLAFSTFGLAIAYLVRPKAATAIANLIFLPLSFCSGFFFPLSQLPEFWRELAQYLPTYHFGRLAWGQVAPAGDVEAFTGIAASPATVHLAWVLGFALLCGAVALLAARRESVTRRA